MTTVPPNGAEPQGISPQRWTTLADNNYLRGWHPIPTGRIDADDDPPKYKKPWLSGLTGYNDFATADQYGDWPPKVRWLQRQGVGGILSLGLRCAPTRIGIDIDNYADKHGLDSLRELESTYGQLPPAPVVTARGYESGSGIRLFRVPEGWRGKTNPAEGIELIQWWHRHIQAPPSWHYTGQLYQLYTNTGVLVSSGLLPDDDKCPNLPDAWREGLAIVSQGGVAGGATSEEVADFERRYSTGPQPDALDGLIKAKLTDADDTHTPMLILLCKAAQEAKGSRYGWTTARDKVRAAAQDSYARRGKRLKQGDWDGAVAWAIASVRDTSEQACYNGWQSEGFKRAAQDAGTVPAEDDEPSSWAPLDLSALITGPALLPTLGTRVDGQCFFYAGKIHWVYGDYEAGKTWFVMVVAAQVLASGGNVLYIDYEDDGTEVAQRMLALGVPKETVIDQSRFCYIRPVGSVTNAKAGAQLTDTLSHPFNFVVLDGVTEAMGLERLNPDKGVDAAMWQHMVPRRVAKTTGAAVACLDHIPKDKDNQRSAIGSTHKMGGIDGAAFKLVNDKPYGRGKVGGSMVLVTKDRPGALRGIEDADYDRKDRSHHVGNLVHNASDPENITATIELPKPSNRTADGVIARPTWCMEQVSAYWRSEPNSAKRTKNKTVSVLYEREKKRKPDTRITLALWKRAVDVLEAEGYAQRGTGQTDGYRLIKPYVESEDVRSGAYCPADRKVVKPSDLRSNP